MNEIFIRNPIGLSEILKQKCVGIAGCGGLGSNAAVALVRTGIGRLVLVDFDKVEESNLNRQYFFLSDIGKNKVDALKAHLLNINPDLEVDVHKLKWSDSDIEIFSECDVLIEAFDRAETKQMLIEAWFKNYSNKPIICASGISGIGNLELIKVQNSGNLYICGDEISDISEGLNSARVAMVANMQASVAISLFINKKV